VDARTATGDLEPITDDRSAVDEEHLRYAPRAPRRHPLLRRVAFVLVPLLLLAAVAWAGWAWTRSQYYVAQDGDGVSIFRGVQVDIPVLHLSEVYQRGDFTLSDLPAFQRAKVEEGIVANDLTDAERILDTLAAQAASGSGSGSGSGAGGASGGSSA
jgi:protein phosphatase